MKKWEIVFSIILVLFVSISFLINRIENGAVWLLYSKPIKTEAKVLNYNLVKSAGYAWYEIEMVYIYEGKEYRTRCTHQFLDTNLNEPKINILLNSKKPEMYISFEFLIKDAVVFILLIIFNFAIFKPLLKSR